MLALFGNFFLNAKGIGQFIYIKQDKNSKDNKNGDHHRFPPWCVHIMLNTISNKSKKR
jgi:hypothetical protein